VSTPAREPRCDQSDLLVSACGHCKGLTELDKPVGFMFFAQLYGRCSGCQVKIEPGDTICSDGHDGYLHEDCAQEIL